ncbi:Alaserpin [Eumeta japonica]|uniref:Alaserpin n=1 Tax=Eumeta variegata TaxID=151549 RepID=A0A4C1VZK6_EUMVA|nr:Alaserpin [Eumeta japonica]
MTNAETWKEACCRYLKFLDECSVSLRSQRPTSLKSIKSSFEKDLYSSAEKCFRTFRISQQPIVNSNPDNSVVLSAFSVLPPLAQLSLASVGESHDELLIAMGLQNDNVLKSIKGVELKLSSKMYVAEDYQIQEQFQVDTRRLFDSEIENINFVKSTEAASEINQWVEDKTNHRIKDLVQPDSLDGDTRAVLVNTIYFKGSWKTKFNKDATTDRNFYVSAANTVRIPTMYIDGEYKYGRNDELNAQGKMMKGKFLRYVGTPTSKSTPRSWLLNVSQVLQKRLPTKQRHLPRIFTSARELITIFKELKENPALLTEASKRMHSTKLEVYLPKFKIETATDLKEAHLKIGVTKIFDSRTARLENLVGTEEPLYVSEAIQRAFIEVNEEGAEAAAANVFGIKYECAYVPFKFKADRPFYYEIKAKEEFLFNCVLYR